MLNNANYLAILSSWSMGAFPLSLLSRTTSLLH